MKWKLPTRAGYWLYLLLLHGALGAMAYFLLEPPRYLLLPVELLLLVSLWAGYRFYAVFMSPARLLAQGEATMKDRDFTVKFQPTQSPEVNRLVQLYNEMIDHLRAERTGREAQHYFLQKVIAVAPIGVVILDFDGRVSLLNAHMRQLLALAETVPLPTHLHEVNHPLAAALLGCPAQQTTLIRTAYNRQFRVERGSFVDRGFTREFLLVQDSTRQLIAAEQAAYGKVIRMMAHEVNNSIGATNSLLHSLVEVAAEEPDKLPSLSAAYLPIAIDRGDNMNAFMRHFADVIRLPAPEKRAVDMSQLVSQIAVLFTERCRAQGIALRCEASRGPLFANIDPAQIEQVLVNALTNALESIGTGGGQIVLAATSQPLGIAVRDDGPGISPAVEAQLFQPFFSTKPKGQGVGLTLSRDILEQHGATYSLRTEGGWTIFFMGFE